MAGISALVLLAFAAPTFAQSNGGRVVVIDIGKVFKEHIRFKQQMEVLKKDMEAFQAYVRNEQTKMQEKAEKLKRDFNKGTPEFKREEETLARQANELQLQSAQKQRDLMEREAKVYHGVYKEVSAEVANFAIKQEISLVLRYNSDPINPDDRNSVLAGVNNSIVYQKNLDITNIIIRQLNQGVADNRGKTTGPAPPIPAPIKRN